MCKEGEGDNEGVWKRYPGNMFINIFFILLFILIVIVITILKLFFRCKGDEFTIDCYSNSTWLPQVELECRQCEGDDCEGSGNFE